MLNLHIRTLLFASIGILVLIAGLLAVQTEAISDSSSNPSGVPNVQGQSVYQTNAYRIPISGSSQDPCFDVSLSEVRECRMEISMSIPAKDLLVDECFDVPVGERASCRNAIQKHVR